MVARKFYWATLRKDVSAYVRGFDVCLASKTVGHKRYGNLQFLPVLTHHWKDLSIDFIIDFHFPRIENEIGMTLFLS